MAFIYNQISSKKEKNNFQSVTKTSYPSTKQKEEKSLVVSNLSFLIVSNPMD